MSRSHDTRVTVRRRAASVVAANCRDRQLPSGTLDGVSCSSSSPARQRGDAELFLRMQLQVLQPSEAIRVRSLRALACLYNSHKKRVSAWPWPSIYLRIGLFGENMQPHISR